MSPPTDWRIVALPEIAEIVCGGTPSTSTPEYWEPEIEWVTAKDISECSVAKIWKTERLISQKGLENSSAKMLPALATLLIARGATMGKCRMIARPMALNQTCYGIVAREGADPRFLFYKLHSLCEHFRSVAHGTVFDTVIGSGLRSLQFAVPNITEQRAIGHILGALDDKIELNRRMNETLEAMARAIFKSWFVDFDPVRVKAEGRQPCGMDSDAAALFPDSFQDSPLGKIPKGWKVGRIGDFVTAVGGSTQAPKKQNTGRAQFILRHRRTCLPLNLQFCSEQSGGSPRQDWGRLVPAYFRKERSSSPQGHPSAIWL